MTVAGTVAVGWGVVLEVGVGGIAVAVGSASVGVGISDVAIGVGLGAQPFTTVAARVRRVAKNVVDLLMSGLQFCWEDYEEAGVDGGVFFVSD